MISEPVDRRILSAFVCVDAITAGTVTKPVNVSTTEQWTVKVNHSGIYVIFNGPGLNLQTTQFIPSGTWPSPVQFEVTLQDLSGRYLSRRADVKAPQGVPDIPPAPAGSTTNPGALAALSNPATVFDPQPVLLYPAPSSPIGLNWAVIHASVTRAGVTPPQALPWAVLQVMRASDNTILANGQADANGEALLAVVGLTVETNTSGTGPVTRSTIAVNVTAYFDPSYLNSPPSWVPNPDDILTNLSNAALKSTSQSAALGSGQELLMNFGIPI
jgi:hypothetical protein